MVDYLNKYQEWKNNVTDQTLIDELNSMNDKMIEDAFYKDLAFGTGGLRGILGAGTNRMNIYVVAQATQGLANYLKKNYDNPSVCIGYDTRINSDVFSRVVLEVLSYNKIKTYIYKEPLPVPMVSFAIRELSCSAGVMITASHNPSKYNGYKVYGDDGCQITNEVADEIQKEIQNTDLFSIKKEEIDENSVNYITEEVIDKYIETVKKQTFLYDEQIDKSINVVYTPLNGTGLKPVTRILDELGYSNIVIVKEQALPDGNFPTCPYPNPEHKEAMILGIEYAIENNADIVIASDPDCDRVGVAVKYNNEYTILNGNQVGVLLFNYICEQRVKYNDIPNDPVLVKTIVTTDMARAIADSYGIKTIDVLTGYKYIGEQIRLLEKENRINDFVFSFEESDGYLSGTYVRDKDGVNGACLVCEMFAFYKHRGISLKDKLDELYSKYGYYDNSLQSYELDGIEGQTRIQSIMNHFRNNELNEIVGHRIKEIKDYSKGVDGLPRSNVIKIIMEDNSSVVIRPSGTEPKIKVYVSTVSNCIHDSKKYNDDLKEFFEMTISKSN